MRTLIQVLQGGLKSLEADIENGLKRLDIVKHNGLITLDEDSAGDLSHNLIVSKCFEQPEPDSEGYLGDDVPTSSVASPTVWKKLLIVQGRMVYLGHTNILDIFLRAPETASSAGWLWEYLCHNQIRRGGKFTLRKMDTTAGVLVPSNETTPVIFEPLEPHIFNSVDFVSSTCDATKYFIPFSGRNPAFDAFFHHERAGIGLQMTLASDHTFNPTGFRMLYGRLGALNKDNEPARENWFIFVIRKGSAFKSKKPSKSADEEVQVLRAGAGAPLP